MSGGAIGRHERANIASVSSSINLTETLQSSAETIQQKIMMLKIAELFRIIQTEHSSTNAIVGGKPRDLLVWVGISNILFLLSGHLIM